MKRQSRLGRIERALQLADAALAVREEAYDLGALALGYHRTLLAAGGVTAGAGIRGADNFVPAALQGAYGSRTPAGVALYLTLRPGGASSGGGGMRDMPGMDGRLTHQRLLIY